MEDSLTEDFKKDDGSLAFLGIEKDPTNVQFHCELTRQSKLVNTTFWVRDIVENIKTKHGENRMLVLISEEKDSPESKCQKFFTNSNDIKYILTKVKELGAFPRRVTMRAEGNNFYIE